MVDVFSCIIVDDEPHAIELLSEQLFHLYKNIRVAATCGDWESALDILRSQRFDIIFMDISLPGKNAIDLLTLLPTVDSEIIFVTAHEEYALDAFHFTTSGYLLKPVTDADLLHAINKAVERVQLKRLAKSQGPAATTSNDRIGVPNKYGIDYVNINDIIYLESINKCTKIVTATKEYISSTYFGKYKTLIDAHPFFQVHRSYIVNLNRILRYELSGIIIMSNKHEIPVARSIRTEFLERFGNNL
jgi:two-component system, LytTR family, response regulator